MGEPAPPASVRIDTTLIDAVDELAAMENCSRSRMLRVLLKFAIENYRTRPPNLDQHIQEMVNKRLSELGLLPKGVKRGA